MSPRKWRIWDEIEIRTQLHNKPNTDYMDCFNDIEIGIENLFTNFTY